MGLAYMVSKIINILFILSLLYAARVITLKFGLLQPKSIQFYNTVVYRPDDFKISGFSLVPPFSSFILLSFSNFNKDVIEYTIKRYDTKSILVSFSNEHNEYLVSHWFKDKALHSIFDNNGMPDEEALRDWEFVFHVKYYTIDSKYKDTDKCIFYKKILQTKKIIMAI